jgi:hypothetical protein
MSSESCDHPPKVLVCAECATRFENIDDALEDFDDLASDYALGQDHLDTVRDNDYDHILLRWRQTAKQKDGKFVLFELTWGDLFFGAAWVAIQNVSAQGQ